VGFGTRIAQLLGVKRSAPDQWTAQALNSRGSSGQTVTPDSALRQSAVWACLRLRADLVSSMPVDVFRQVGGLLLEVPKPGWLVSPSPGLGIVSWLWGSQFDLDRYGNSFGIITSTDGYGFPAAIDPVGAGDVTVITKGRQIANYRIGGELYAPSEIWHERQYRAAGSPVGMSPIAWAAMSIKGYLSAQQFAVDWYSSGAAPSGVLKNTGKTLTQEQARTMKERFRASVQDRDIFVTGNDWEWSPAQGAANDAGFLDEMRYGVTDVARFLGVPGDIIDAEGSTGDVTYANVVQRNLQLLVMNLGPAITRREEAFTAATPQARVVKLNTDAMLRMDPLSRAQVISTLVASRVQGIDEARALYNWAPLTQPQTDQFLTFWPAKPAPALVPKPKVLSAPSITAEVDDLPEPLAIGSGWTRPE
jgi:HK97 family phage portal protein